MNRFIKNLQGQLNKIEKEHFADINKDTYWRGVKIGLETAITLANDLKRVADCKFTDEIQWLKNLLPERYNCEPRKQGVYCYDTTGRGICDDHMAHEKYNPETDNQWGLIVKAIEKKFGDRLMEICGQEPQTWSKFTVYLRPEN